jgi:hypothetical protein
MTQSRKSNPPLTSVSPWTRLLHLSAVAGVVLAGGQRMAAQSDASAEPGGTTLSILGPELQDYGWTPGMAPTAAEAELEDMSAARRGYFAVPGVSKGFDFLYDRRDELHHSTGVRLGAAYTLLFQGLSGGP